MIYCFIKLYVYSLSSPFMKTNHLYSVKRVRIGSRKIMLVSIFYTLSSNSNSIKKPSKNLMNILFFISYESFG